MSEHPQCTGLAVGSRGELEVVPALPKLSLSENKTCKRMKMMGCNEHCHREAKEGP